MRAVKSGFAVALPRSRSQRRPRDTPATSSPDLRALRWFIAMNSATVTAESSWERMSAWGVRLRAIRFSSDESSDADRAAGRFVSGADDLFDFASARGADAAK